MLAKFTGHCVLWQVKLTYWRLPTSNCNPYRKRPATMRCLSPSSRRRTSRGRVSCVLLRVNVHLSRFQFHRLCCDFRESKWPIRDPNSLLRASWHRQRCWKEILHAAVASQVVDARKYRAIMSSWMNHISIVSRSRYSMIYLDFFIRCSEVYK
jgi:hypothetical protein